MNLFDQSLPPKETARRNRTIAESPLAQPGGQATPDLFFEHSPLPMWIYDLETYRFLKANLAALEKYGYSRDEFLAMTIKDIRPPEDVERLLIDLKKERPAFQHSGVWRHRRKDGSILDVEIHSHTLEYEGRKAALVVAIDVTQQKQAERALQDSQRFTSEALNSLSASIAILDERGIILAVNRAWETFARDNGADPTLVSNGANYLQVCDTAAGMGVQDARLAAEGIRAVMQGKHDFFSMEYNCHSPREQRWFMLRVTRFTGEGPLRVVTAHENITARKQAEEEIRKRSEDLALLDAINTAANRNASLEDIIALISEQTKTLFQSMGATLYLLDAERKRLVMQNMALPQKQLAQIEKILGITIPRLIFDLADPHPFQKLLKTGRAYLETDPEKIREFIGTYVYGVPASAIIRSHFQKVIPLLVKLLGLKSHMVVPLVFNGEIIGTLDIGSRREFNAEDLRRMESIAGGLTEIIRRKQAEMTIEQSEERYRDLVENIHDLIGTHDLQGNILTINQAAASLLGVEQGALLQMNLRDLLVPEVRDEFDDYLAAIQRDGQAKGLMIVQAANGGRRIWEYDNTLRKDPGGAPIVRALARDVTEQIQAQEALRESEKRLRRLVENSSGEISILSAAGELLYESPSTHPTLGYQPGEYVGRNLFQLIHPDDVTRVQEQFARLVREPNFHPHEEFRLLHRDGNWIWVEAVGSNMLSEPSVGGIVINYHNITERKQAEEKLQTQFDELQRWYNATIGREERVLQLKREVNELLRKLNEPIRYPSAE